MVVFALNSSLVQLYVNRSDEWARYECLQRSVSRRNASRQSDVGLLIKQSSAPVIMAANGFLVVVMALWFLLRDRKLIRL